MPAVALPSVRGTQRRGAADHVAGAALLADAATGDVVDDDPVVGAQPSAVGAHGDHLAARFVACDDALVGLRSGTQVLPIDGPDVAPADRRSLHPQQDLTMPRFRDVDRYVLDGAVAG